MDNRIALVFEAWEKSAAEMIEYVAINADHMYSDKDNCYIQSLRARNAIRLQEARERVEKSSAPETIRTQEVLDILGEQLRNLNEIAREIAAEKWTSTERRLQNLTTVVGDTIQLTGIYWACLNEEEKKKIDVCREGADIERLKQMLNSNCVETDDIEIRVRYGTEDGAAASLFSCEEQGK